MASKESGVVTAIRKAIVRVYPQAWVFKVAGSPMQMAGVPDLLVVVDGRLVGLEVKYQRPGESLRASKARASQVQLIQIGRLRSAGATADVVTSAEEALDVIKTCLEGERS